MKIQLIVYTLDSEQSVAWYTELLGVEPSYRSEVWTTFDVAGITLAIHRIDGDLPPETRVSLSFIADDSLESLIERWSSSSQIQVLRGIEDEVFGRSLLIADPDGTVIQVNEHHGH